jgi:pimeloyl-ACP methyl ester carboxylesterase
MERRDQPAGERNGANARGRGFVLLHGAMLGSWIWERVLPALDAPAVAIDLPGRGSRPAEIGKLGLVDVIDSVLDDIRGSELQSLVLVAHSLSGILVPGIVSRTEAPISHVVFVGAAVPEPGRRYLDLLPTFERHFLRLILRLQKKGPLTPAWAARKALCNDLDPATTQSVVERLSREVPRLYSDPIPGELPPDLPSVYVKLAKDQAVSTATQEDSIARLPNVRIESLDAGHLPMLAQPERLAAILNSVRAPRRAVEHGTS